jgi:hypothetical protein
MRLRVGLAAVLALAAGCTTTIQGDPHPVGAAGSGAVGDVTAAGAGPGAGGTSGAPELIDPPQAALDRLTQLQYVRTIEAAFPGFGLPDVELPADGTDGIFTTNAPSPLGDFSAYFDAAQTLGGAIASKLTSRCAWADSPKDCVRDHLGTPLRVGYRRPITADDEQAVSDLLAEHLGRGLGAEEALAGGVARLLLSPDFIFRMERGVASLPDQSGRRLSDAELAARLSYLLTDAPPDSALRALTESGELASREGLRAEAERLFDGPLGEAIVWRFVVEWLDLDNLEKRPQTAALAPELLASMRAETRVFVDRVLHEDRAPVRELFTARYSYIDKTMAEHYGLTGSFGEEPKRYDWAGEQGRLGVLTHASVLTALTASSRDKDVIPRGRVLFTRLLCGELESPDASLQSEEVSDRTLDARCKGCHMRMDPMGRTFSMYDELGRYQDGPSVPGVIDTDELEGSFDTVADLAKLIASSERFETCVSSLAFRFAFGRRETSGEADYLSTLRHAFGKRGSFRDLILALVTSDAFRVRLDPTEGDRCAP